MAYQLRKREVVLPRNQEVQPTHRPVQVFYCVLKLKGYASLIIKSKPFVDMADKIYNQWCLFHNFVKIFLELKTNIFTLRDHT